MRQNEATPYSLKYFLPEYIFTHRSTEVVDQID